MRKNFKKIDREGNLHKRAVNIVNHCCTHQCSDYCLRTKSVPVSFDEKKHKDIPDDEVYRNKNNELFVYETQQECRMNFGKPLKYDGTGEKNRTRGIPPSMHRKIKFDNNGLPKYHAKRNHLHILQEPYSFYW